MAVVEQHVKSYEGANYARGCNGANASADHGGGISVECLRGSGGLGEVERDHVDDGEEDLGAVSGSGSEVLETNVQTAAQRSAGRWQVRWALVKRPCQWKTQNVSEMQGYRLWRREWWRVNCSRTATIGSSRDGTTMRKKLTRGFVDAKLQTL